MAQRDVTRLVMCIVQIKEIAFVISTIKNFDTVIKSGRQAIFLFDFMLFVVSALQYALISLF